MTITGSETKELLEKHGFIVVQESSYEHIQNSAGQRLRYSFSMKYRGRLELNCWLRHNLEGHNDNRWNTHRFNIGTYGCFFSKHFDFKGKDNGPTANEIDAFLEKLARVMNGLADLL